MDNYSGVIHSTGVDKPVEKAATPAPVGAGVASWSVAGGEAYSQRVANVKPTAMKAMPTMRFFWSRSLKTGTFEVSWAIA